MPDPVLFVGPSAFGLDLDTLCGGVRRPPPAGRGDVEQLVADEPPGVLLLCDGVFQCRPAVSHAELCRAIDAGWQVWGVSSIGAIRAWEMRNDGMRGFGIVHAMFQRLPEVSDDEVCVLHFPQAPWFPATEALVNMRHALDSLRDALAIPARCEARLLGALRGLWFGDRTLERIHAIMRHDARLGEDTAAALLAWLRRHRAKTIDLANLLETRPWLQVQPAATESS